MSQTARAASVTFLENEWKSVSPGLEVLMDPSQTLAGGRLHS
jgi:hypothetical protein